MKPETAVLDWEAMWAPYDADTYTAVLQLISPEDVVLDIGAGDLRLTRRIAQLVRAVVAIERNPSVIPQQPLPANCTLLVEDAREVPFPEGITTAVLLMRHCAHFALYVAKLQAIGCQRLITNARWRFGPELIDLCAPRISFTSLPVGWYACLCGHTGFVPGPVELLTQGRVEVVAEVDTCPACAAILAG